MGYREMPIQIRAVDVMAGGGGRAGPAPSIHHQAPGKQAGTTTLGIQTQTFQMFHFRYLLSVRFQVSLLAVQTQPLQVAGVGSTRGSGNSGVASYVWVV